MACAVRFQFSLRTLALAPLLLGSAATLWWNWSPWHCVYVSAMAGTPLSVQFSDDDQYFLVQRDDVSSFATVLEVRRVATGERHTQFQYPFMYEVAISGQYAAFHRDHETPKVLYNWLDNRHIPVVDKVIHEYADFSTDRSRLAKHSSTFQLRYALMLVTENSYAVVYRLPKFEIEWESGTHSGARLLRDGRLLVLYEDSFELRDLDNRPGAQASSLPGVRGLPARRVMKHEADLRSCQFIEREHCTAVNTPNGFYLFDADTKEARLDPGALLLDVSPDATRALIAPRENGKVRGGTRLVEWPSRKTLKDFSGAIRMPLVFNCDASLILDKIAGTVFDGRTGAILWNHAGDGGSFSANGKFLLPAKNDSATLEIKDARTGRTALMLPSLRYPDAYPAQSQIAWANHSDDFALYSGTSVTPSAEASTRLAYWRLHRPWQWYGPSCLPEFWLTLLFAAGFFWSLLKDRTHRRLSLRARTQP